MIHVKSNELKKYLSEDVINEIYLEIKNDVEDIIAKRIGEGKELKEFYYGAMACDRPIIGMGIMTVWIEYDCKTIYRKGFKMALDSGITDCVIYKDCIPDYVLDQYSKIKNTLIT